MHAVGIIPFGKSGWEMFGQLGIGSAQVDTDCCGDDNQTVGSAGIGVRFFPTPHLGISLQTDAYAYEEDAYYGNYDLGIAATQLGSSTRSRRSRVSDQQPVRRLI